jgi:hypothetical protein
MKLAELSNVGGEMMKRNESNIDRVLRVILGVVLLALFFAGPKTYLGLLGLIPLITGLVGFCPLYYLLGISTCPLARGQG